MSGRPAPLAEGRAWRRRGAAAALVLVCGCAAMQRDPPPPPARPEASLPAGAIAVGPDLYRVPIGADAEGCMMYRLYSPTRLVTQAIAWRKPGGGFTHDRRAADCAG